MNWVKRLFLRRRLYGDLSEEIREHLKEKIEELVAAGMPRKEAAYAARREFGNVTLSEEDGREVWRWPSIESFFADLRYGLRALRKTPAFSLTVIITLCLGIGLNSAIFSMVTGILLRDPPSQRVRMWQNRSLKLSSATTFGRGGSAAIPESSARPSLLPSRPTQ